jgi:hypothetical protein
VAYPSDVHALDGLSLTAALDVVGGRPGGWTFAAFTEGQILLKCRGEYDRGSLQQFLLALYTNEIIVETDQGIVSGTSWAGSWTCTPEGPLERRPDGALHFRPRLRVPAPSAKGADKKPTRGERVGGGNSEYDDTAAAERARAILKAMKKPSKRRAAAMAVNQLIAEGHPVDGATPEAWAERVRKDI